MKKHLIAAAVAAAVAVPAMAQNVEVYGIADVAFQYYDNGTDSYLRQGGNGLSTSRLGVRGSEDLGGGMKATFNLEAGVSYNNGDVNSTDGRGTNNHMFSRAANVGIEGAFGAFKIGRLDFATTNIDDAVSQAGNLGAAAQLFTPSGGATFDYTGVQEVKSQTAAAKRAPDGLGNDMVNGITYTSPTFSGIKVEVGYGTENSTSNLKTSTSGFAVMYSSGPLTAQAGYVMRDGGGTAVAKESLTQVGVAYDFGLASVGYAYGLSDVNTSSNDKDLKYHLVSARVPLSDGYAVHAGFQTYKEENVTGSKADNYFLALSKAMSKRTTLYAAYLNTENGSAGTFETRGLGAAAGDDTSAFHVGVRHTF